MLGKLGELYQIKKKLGGLRIPISGADGKIKIVMDGTMHIHELTISKDLLTLDESSLSELIRETINKAMKNTQAEISKHVSGLGM